MPSAVSPQPSSAAAPAGAGTSVGAAPTGLGGGLREDLSLEELRRLQQLNLLARTQLLQELDAADIAEMLAEKEKKAPGAATEAKSDGVTLSGEAAGAAAAPVAASRSRVRRS